MAQKPLNFIINLEVYPFDIIVSVDEADQALVKKLMSYGYTEEQCEPFLNMKGCGRCDTLPLNHILIRIRKCPNKYHTLSVISHEIFHATTFLMKKIGAKFKVGISDESYAYLIGYLTEKICQKLKM